jgi:hypothetical protein
MKKKNCLCTKKVLKSCKFFCKRSGLLQKKFFLFFS